MFRGMDPGAPLYPPTQYVLSPVWALPNKNAIPRGVPLTSPYTRPRGIAAFAASPWCPNTKKKIRRSVSCPLPPPQRKRLTQWHGS